MHFRRVYFSIILCVGIAVAGSLSAETEKKVSKADLPPAVLKTAAEISRGATVKAYLEDREDGKLTYEVEMLVNGRSRDVTISPLGEILEVEEQVDLNSLSRKVQASLRKKAGSGSITKVESLTKHDKLVAYEAQVKTASRHKEVQVGPQGQNLSRSE